mgnify:CR=1 FL=1|tara:strand:+ start:1098 stop:1286 length:189 start_codon:yes stop_codon:yes gene_type:complete
MKVTLYHEEINLATYTADDLKMFITDLVDDIEFYSNRNRDVDYDHAKEVLEETLEYILWERK